MVFSIEHLRGVHADQAHVLDALDLRRNLDGVPVHDAGDLHLLPVPVSRLCLRFRRGLPRHPGRDGGERKDDQDAEREHAFTHLCSLQRSPLHLASYGLRIASRPRGKEARFPYGPPHAPALAVP
ncbi:MAG: hypothetical protein M3R38_10620 [Actinomycetota bacterium]|nr:hypothetical protein [Actinomycetota bacterium]